MRPYDIGDPEIDRLIEELVAKAGGGVNADLIEEMIVTSLKLLRDDAERGDVKLTNAALKEMRYPFRIFSGFKDVRKVSIFGSARTKPDDPDYKMAAEFARLMTEDRNWMVITGAGPGIMEAGNAGAGRERSFGVNIRLPFEADANRHVLPDRLINFKYFFTRKLIFVKESHAFALFPGGFGTMDEAFEALTLIQTGKSPMAPIVLIESDGTGYWDTWEGFVREDLLGNRMITEEDLGLFTMANDVVQAADAICDFYLNYHSQRYVEGKLVLRMARGPDPSVLDQLNDEYSDIVVSGDISRVNASSHEVADDDAVELDRISFEFNRRHFGRLRQLINKLNTL